MTKRITIAVCTLLTMEHRFSTQILPLYQWEQLGTFQFILDGDIIIRYRKCNIIIIIIILLVLKVT